MYKAQYLQLQQREMHLSFQFHFYGIINLFTLLGIVGLVHGTVGKLEALTIIDHFYKLIQLVITFGIDNRDSSAYNKQFMYGMDYQFPQDTLNSNLTYAACGSKNLMYVKQGLYHFDIVDSTVIVKVPYLIVP